MKYSEHIEAVKYVRDSIEKEIRWLKNIFFSDILEDMSLKESVKEYKMPLIYIWYKESGKDIPEKAFMDKIDKAVWELNVLGEVNQKQQKKTITDVATKTKCPREVIYAIMEAMDLVYEFSGNRKFDSTDGDNIRGYCNLYMADYVHKTTNLLLKMLIPVNDALEQVKIDFKKN